MPTPYRPASAPASAPDFSRGLLLLTRSNLRALGVGACRSEPERLGNHAEDLGVVHLPADAVAARPAGGQNHVLAGMYVGIDHRRQITEAEHGAGNVLVTLIRHVGAGLLARDRGII